MSELDEQMAALMIRIEERGWASRARAAVERMRRTPVRAVLVCLALVAVVVGVVALKPASASYIDRGEAVHVDCGADAYFFGHPDTTVARVCGRAYAGRAHLLEASLLFVALGVVAAASVAFSAVSRRARRTFGLVVCAGVLAIIGVAALGPVVTQLGDANAPTTVSCSLDTYLVGHPDRTIASACRSRYGTHALVALTALVGSIAAGGVAWRTRPRVEQA